MNQPKYIFIVGSSRSGTTMISRVLNQHHLVHTFKELHFFSQIYSSRKKDHISAKKAIEIMNVLLMRQEFGLFQNKNKNKFSKISNSILSVKQNRWLLLIGFVILGTYSTTGILILIGQLVYLFIQRFNENKLFLPIIFLSFIPGVI